MRIVDVLISEGLGAFANDDHAAIRAGAARDGFLYRDRSHMAGFRRVRQPAQALSVILLFEDGTISYGDAVSVQYAGVAGRDPVLHPASLRGDLPRLLRKAFVGHDVSSFRASSDRLDGLELSTAVRYGVSQALLGGAAGAARRTVAEIIAAEYETGAPLRETPIFAQCGEDRRIGVDRMVLREVDELPHGLINDRSLVGDDGAVLLEYVRWVRDRIFEVRDSESYEPVLHFDCYGTLGEVFSSRDACAAYITTLGEVAGPLRLRIEHPVQADSRDAQIEALHLLRTRLEAQESTVELVADEWCNTLDDVQAFAASGAAHMIQVKTPDLGSLDETVRALLACKAGGAKAYCGGSCTDTERAAQLCAGVAMGTDADLILARPGMGVDEAIMVVRNEMRRTRALVEAREGDAVGKRAVGPRQG